MSQTEQLTLPYALIENVANRDYLRKNFKIGTTLSYKIPFNEILIRDGHNRRKHYDGIEELAESIFTHKLQQPFVLDIQNDGKYYIKRGHRRHRAIQLLVNQGRFPADGLVEFFPSPKEDELAKLVDQYTSNNFQMPLLPVEQADVVYYAKHYFGTKKTHEELAALFGMSRQKVDNLIKFAEASDDVKLAIKDMTFTSAVQYIREEGKRKKQTDKAEEDSHKTPATVQPKEHDINAEELKELNELEKDIALNEGEENDEESAGFVNTDTGEVVDEIPKEENTEPQVAPSVITEPPAVREKGKFDESRPEIKQIQNIIKLLDKVEVKASLIPNAQTAKDINDCVKWMREDAMELRDWVHSNKKQNKIR